MVKSIFAQRLNRRIPLSPAEAAFLDELEARSVYVDRRGHIVCAEDEVHEAFVLKSGWAISYSAFPHGSRQIRRLHLPGDLLAIPSLAMRHHPEHIEALTPVVVSPFRRSEFARLFVEHPRLTAIMYVFAQEERITACDRMACIGQLDCKQRLAFLLLDVLNRVRAIDASMGSTFEMHLAREQMAEITGMTPVHASRMWNELIAERCIAADGHTVVILDEVRLQTQSGYVNRAANLDFSWIPKRGSNSQFNVDGEALAGLSRAPLAPAEL